MCGLIALISKSTKPLTHTALELFINSLTVGVLRGKDSTGLFIITTEGNVHTLKLAANSAHFLEHHKTKEFFTLLCENILPFY
jgi:glucosamine 6-phosphate synthetase-like amidotransferase/phosphosugar isomerase protein